MSAADTAHECGVPFFAKLVAQGLRRRTYQKLPVRVLLAIDARVRPRDALGALLRDHVSLPSPSDFGTVG